MTTTVLYDDAWGCIFYRPDERIVELRWYDTTADLSAEEFQAFLARFAGALEKHHGSAAFVDATSFKMNPKHMNPAWRDANITPRYSGAGVPKFAFHMPAGMPLIGKSPAPEGAAKFPTGYFGARRDALAWLHSGG